MRRDAEFGHGVRRFGAQTRDQYPANLILREFLPRADPSSPSINRNRIRFDRKIVTTLILVCMLRGCNMCVIPRSDVNAFSHAARAWPSVTEQPNVAGSAAIGMVDSDAPREIVSHLLLKQQASVCIIEHRTSD